jgi:ATP-dependent Zn protease
VNTNQAGAAAKVGRRGGASGLPLGARAAAADDGVKTVARQGVAAVRPSVRLMTNIEQATAYHEAGHAVAHYLLRRAGRLREVTIVPDAQRGTPGRAPRWTDPYDLDDGPWSDLVKVRLQHEAMVLLAGGIAERRFAGRTDQADTQSDYEKAAELALAISGSEHAADAFLDWLGTVTEDLVADRWPAVEAIAAALLQQRTLSAHDVDQLVTEALTGA